MRKTEKDEPTQVDEVDENDAISLEGFIKRIYCLAEGKRQTKYAEKLKTELEDFKQWGYDAESQAVEVEETISAIEDLIDERLGIAMELNSLDSNQYSAGVIDTLNEIKEIIGRD